jgi:outer membrane protein assembly factor BamB
MRTLLTTAALLCVFAGFNLIARSEDQVTGETPKPIAKFSDADWPWWRGPNRNGVANPDQEPPLKWSDSENVLWKVPVPGRGHGSPIVVGDRVYLTAADEKTQVQSVLCFDRETGKQIWKTDIHKGGFTTKGNKKSTQASSTVACDGERLFVNFLNSDAVFTTALSMDGNQIWQTKLTDYTVHQGFGTSPSPYGPNVLVIADNKGAAGGVVAALNRKNGRIVWKHSRPSTPNYPSPVVLNVSGRDQLLLTGCNLVSGFDPLSGDKLWEIAGATTECVTSTVTDGNVIITSGGYPKNHVAAVLADGSGKVVWEHPTRVYVPSMVVQNGILYATSDDGIAFCWNCATGEALWKGRLGGTFTASPVLVGDLLYGTNEAGQTFIFKASPESFELVAENKLGDEAFATPVICGSRIYTRVAFLTDEGRREMLYCIGK